MSLYQARFRQATTLFYSGQYDEGITLINQLIDVQPINSLLYVNRALFFSQLGQDQGAIVDLERAISLNPFNYIAYFNLFSVLTRNHRDIQAFDNLCCSLSCMYLLKAKVLKDIVYAQKALQYASNNQAAQLLTDILELNGRKYEKRAASSSKDSKQQQLQTIQAGKNHKFKQLQQPDSKFRLNGSFSMVGMSDLAQNTRLRVKQFNELYFELNDKFGTITQKVPQQQPLISNKTESQARQRSEGSSSRQSYIEILVNDDYFRESKDSTLNIVGLPEDNPQSLTNIHKTQPKSTISQQTNVHMHSIYYPFQNKLNMESVIEEKSMEYDDQRVFQPPSAPHSLIDPSANFPDSKQIQLNPQQVGSGCVQ